MLSNVKSTPARRNSGTARGCGPFEVFRTVPLWSLYGPALSFALRWVRLGYVCYMPLCPAHGWFRVMHNPRFGHPLTLTPEVIEKCRPANHGLITYPRCTIANTPAERQYTHWSGRWRRGFSSSTFTHLYSATPHLVSPCMPPDVGTGLLAPDRTGSMQDSASELLRITLPRISVNKEQKEGGGPLPDLRPPSCRELPLL
jgi:hypothetical protein